MSPCRTGRPNLTSWLRKTCWLEIILRGLLLLWLAGLCSDLLLNWFIFDCFCLDLFVFDRTSLLLFVLACFRLHLLGFICVCFVCYSVWFYLGLFVFACVCRIWLLPEAGWARWLDVLCWHCLLSRRLSYTGGPMRWLGQDKLTERSGSMSECTGWIRSAAPNRFTNNLLIEIKLS